MDKYILITWPESQVLMDEEWFDNERFLASMDRPSQEWVGSSAYFVPEHRLEELENDSE